MDPIEFAREAEKRGVSDIISDSARIWKDGALQQAEDFNQIDWAATTLALAYAFRIERESNDELGDRIDNLEDSNEALHGLIDEMQGRLDGRDELISDQKEAIDNQQQVLEDTNNRLSAALKSIEALYVVIETLGDRIHDIRQGRDY